MEKEKEGMYMSDSIDDFKDETVYSPEKSAEGTNAYYLSQCETIGGRANYAVCQKRIKDVKTGKVNSAYADCSTAISRKTCHALTMQQEEREKGQAMYYISRGKLHAFQDQQAADAVVRQASGVKFTPKQYPKYVPREATADFTPQTFASKSGVGSLKVVSPDGGFAAAINQVIKDLPKEVAPVVLAPIQAESMKSGMSLIEMARNKIASQLKQGEVSHV